MSDLLNTAPAAPAVETPATVAQPQPETAPQPKWWEGLPEQLKGEKVIHKYDSQEKALQGLVELNKVFGKRKEEYTAQDLKTVFTPEEMHHLANVAGLPASVEEYKLPKFDEFLGEEASTFIKKKALDLQITPDKMEAIIESQRELTEYTKAKQAEAWRAECMNKYGVNLDVTVKQARAAVNEFADDPEQMKREINQAGLGDNPMILGFLAKIGKLMAEDKIPHSTLTRVKDELSEVNTTIKDLIHNPEFRKKLSQRDKAAQDRLNDLYKRQADLERG